VRDLGNAFNQIVRQQTAVSYQLSAVSHLEGQAVSGQQSDMP
jgi:hypothetical protein